jgi:Zn-dependent protease
MFGRRFRLGEVLGFEIRADPSWAVLVLVVVWSLASGFFPALYPNVATASAWILAILGTAGLFISLLIHELSHSVVARGYGLHVGGITLFLLGGAAEMQSEPATPKAEFLIAAAGPVVSLALAFVCYLATLVGGAVGLPNAWVGVPYYLSIVNLALAVFNMLPAFPMDGGRILRAALWAWRRDIRRATRVATRLGQGLGMLLIAAGAAQAVLAGNLVGGMWWALIGLFVHGNAGATYTRLEERLSLRGLRVRDMMTRRPISVAPDMSLQALVDEVVYRHHHHRYPVVVAGRPIGYVGTHHLRAVAQAEWPRVTVREVMTPADRDNTIPAELDAQQALDLVQARRDGWIMVVEHGVLVGVLALRDLQACLRLRRELGSPV